MTIETATLRQIQDRLVNELIVATGSQIDPNVRNNFAIQFIRSLAVGFDDNNNTIKQAIKQIFIHTADREFLINLWGKVLNINPLLAKTSRGFVNFIGVNGTTLQQGTILQNANGDNYSVLSNSTISNNSFSASSAIIANGSVTLNFASDINLATGQQVNVSGSSQSAINGLKNIIVNSRRQISFSINDSNINSSTGVITIESYYGVAEVRSENGGEDKNQNNGSTLNSQLLLQNIDNFIVNIDGIAGGTDDETTESYRQRLINKFNNFGNFTQSAVSQFVLKNNNVSRVFIRKAKPSTGQVEIYCVNDVSNPITLSSQELLDIKNQIIDTNDGILPVNTSADDVFVLNPTLVNVNLTIPARTPNTEEIRDAILNNLRDFFRNNVILGQSIQATELRSIIESSIDSLGNRVIINTSSLTQDISVEDNELAVLGNITFT